MKRPLIVVAWIGLMLSACQRQPPLPTLPPTAYITAQLHSVPDMGIHGIDHVDVPKESMLEIMRIITPATFVEGGIRPHLNCHVADVYLHHDDSSVTKVTVRSAGHNPAAVTVDGLNYYYASADGPADGGMAVARLLTQFHFDAQNDQ